MRIWQNGMHRDHGAKELADSKPTRMGLADADNDNPGPRVLIKVSGVAHGKSAHVYRIYLSAEELAQLVEKSIEDRCKDRTARSYAKAIGAFIREALREAD